MGIQFFLALLCCVALPTLLSRLLRVHKIFPLVFIQLLLGLTLRLSGCGDWLKGHGVDLLHGPLGDSLHGLGLLTSPCRSHRAVLRRRRNTVRAAPGASSRSVSSASATPTPTTPSLAIR